MRNRNTACPSSGMEKIRIQKGPPHSGFSITSPSGTLLPFCRSLFIVNDKVLFILAFTAPDLRRCRRHIFSADPCASCRRLIVNNKLFLSLTIKQIEKHAVPNAYERNTAWLCFTLAMPQTFGIRRVPFTLSRRTQILLLLESNQIYSGLFQAGQL